MTSASGRLLVTGAFERDNVGDLLYPLLLAEAFSEYELTLAAIAEVSTGELLKLPVVPLAGLLEKNRFDAAMIAGGAVLPLRLTDALAMNEISQQANGQDLNVPPYVPELSRSNLNYDTPLLVNSVGTWRLRKLPVRLRRRLLTELNGASSLTVRDLESLANLKLDGVPARLVPDAIHALSAYWDGGEREAVVTLQASRELLDRFGDALVPALVRALQQPAATHLRKLRLVAAGIAPGHDSYDELAKLAAELVGHDYFEEVSVLRDRSPQAFVAAISRSSLFIGHSLHGRVVASSYDVPRISFDRPKTTLYAQCWDPDMPFGVEPATLSIALGRALSPNVQETARGQADIARRQAIRELTTLKRQIRGLQGCRRQVAARRDQVRRQLSSPTIKGHDLGTSAIRRLQAYWNHWRARGGRQG